MSSSRTYALRLSGSAEVSVELTGMTTDFDCTVAGNDCTNRDGTADDSWNGTLAAGDHKIVVYPDGGGSGDYTLTVSARAPSDGNTGTRTEVTTLFDTSETNVSASRTYRFTLARAAQVDVALTGLTIDFDCRVGSSLCTNRAGTLDDSWSDDLEQGSHSVVVYPYDSGPGNYSLSVTGTETITFVAQPTGSTSVMLCEEDEDGNAIEGSCLVIDTTTTKAPDPGDPGPPPGAGPGEGDPGPGQSPDSGGGGGGGNDDDDETPSTEQQLANAVADALERLEQCSVYNDLREGGGNIVEYDPSSYISAANILDEISHEGASCSNPLKPFAHVDAIPGSEIHICPPFYSLTLTGQSQTIIHEGLHLMGYRHRDFLLPNGEPAQDGRQMDEAISASCYAE